MKSLHVCNIANVAYGYCKMLVEQGHSVDLRCHDMKHLMSQPEWDDLELDSSDFPNENNFYLNSADFGEYQRPEWYLSQDLEVIAEKSFLPRSIVNAMKHLLPVSVKERIRPYYWELLTFQDRFFRRVGKDGNFSAESSQKTSSGRLEAIADESRKYGKKWSLNKTSLRRFLPHAVWLESHLNNHDVIFAYVLSPIYAMIYGKRPYVSVEIGTMRDVPLFDGNYPGKLLGLAYRKSDYLLLTNPDNNIRAERLGIHNYSFCPHPVDETVYTEAEDESSLRKDLMEKYKTEFLIFAPARQNWAIKGNDKYLQAFAKFLKRGVRATLLIPAWGQEVDRSKELCRSLEMDGQVIWLRPLSERVLLQYYQACDLVLDQFQLGVFGLITPKAMACSKPVLTSYDKSLNNWCFSEHPPVVSCREVEEIYERMVDLYNRRSKRIEIGRSSRTWILKEYSKSRVTKTLLDAMKSAQESFARKKWRKNST